MSALVRISTGVLQGSVLCPLLFFKHIKDLSLLSNNYIMLRYADNPTFSVNKKNSVPDDILNYV